MPKNTLLTILFCCLIAGGLEAQQLVLASLDSLLAGIRAGTVNSAYVSQDQPAGLTKAILRERSGGCWGRLLLLPAQHLMSKDQA